MSEEECWKKKCDRQVTGEMMDREGESMTDEQCRSDSKGQSKGDRGENNLWT